MNRPRSRVHIRTEAHQLGVRGELLVLVAAPPVLWLIGSRAAEQQQGHN